MAGLGAWPSSAQMTVHGVFCYGFVVAVSAQGLIDVLFSEYDKLVVLGKTVRMVGEIAAFDADRMDLLYVFSYCHESRHRTERLSGEIRVQTGDYDSYPSVGESLGNFYDRIVEELGFIDADDIDIA